MSSFDELRAQNRAAGRVSKAEARRQIAEFLGHSPAAEARAELLRALDGPIDASARARCEALVKEVVDAMGLLNRPGNVEQLWYLDGLMDRVLEP